MSTTPTRRKTRGLTGRSAVLLGLLWWRGRGGAAGGAHVVGDRGNEVMWKMSQGCLEVVSLVSRLCAASSGAHHPLTQHVASEAGLSPSSPERLGDVISRLLPRSHRAVTFTRYSLIDTTMADTKKMTKEELDQKRDVPFSRYVDQPRRSVI